MSIFTKIEKKYNWNFKKAPVRLRGGYLHEVYKVETKQGTYVLKVLNDFVMQRKTAMENFTNAEQLEQILEQNEIWILPALSFDKRKMQEIDGKFFYLFKYYEGKALQPKEITEYHCMEMGKVLAKIHSIDMKLADGHYKEMWIDWDFYLEQLKKVNVRIYTLLKENYKLLITSQTNGNRARKRLPKLLAICHNDMDCKNVLWNGKDYRIIDLECLSYNNPLMELYELALCWAGYQDGAIDFRLWQAFLQGYESFGGQLPTDWQTLYDCNNGRLEWLEYNLKRVLGIDCGEEEKEIGLEQVEKTIQQIRYYAKMEKPILAHCK